MLKDITLLIVIVGLIYSAILKGFFAQDEWSGFGYYFEKGSKVISEGLIPGYGHYVPLNHLVAYGLFRSFGLTYEGYAIVSILLHSITVVLVYIFLKHLTEDRKIALVAGLLFASNPASHQATSWVLTDVNTHGATILGILSCLFFLSFIKVRQLRRLVIGMAFLIGSLLFKEITIGLFLWIPLMCFAFKEKRSIGLTIGLVTTSLLIVYILIRGTGIHLAKQNAARPFVAPYSRTSEQVVYSLLTLPIKAVSQSLIPPHQLFNWSQAISLKWQRFIPVEYGTTQFDNFVEQKIFEPLNFIIFTLVIIVVIFAHNTKYRNLIFLSLLWTMINSWIYVLAPGKAGIISEIESRNLYLPSLGMALFVTLIINMMVTTKRKLILVIGLILTYYIFNLEINLAKVVVAGQLRKQILTQIKVEHPKLNPKTIFYTESDTSYYGLPPKERILPFQSGLGQTLLTWYQPTEHWSKDFFADNFLWDIQDQGYRGITDRGFGYFRDFDSLTQSLVKNGLGPESIISYRFNSSNNRLEDMTSEIQGRVEGSLISKRLVDTREFVISSPFNPSDLSFTIDNNRDSKWDSQLPYATPQFLLLSFSRPLKIAKIEIDSYNDQNQDRTGYEILVSLDNKEWQRVFYSKKYLPDLQGMNKIFIKPTLVRFLKINQIGDHKFSSWVINELKLYTAL